MKKNVINITLWFAACQLVSGCSVIEGIFKAGVWSGILLVAVTIAAIIFIISKITRK